MIDERMIKIYELLSQVNDPMFFKFFDPDSDRMLDEKIEVLESVIAGKPPDQIPKYYDVLELYPKGDLIWD